jgi:hypothetical protein
MNRVTTSRTSSDASMAAVSASARELATGWLSPGGHRGPRISEPVVVRRLITGASVNERLAHAIVDLGMGGPPHQTSRLGRYAVGEFLEL